MSASEFSKRNAYPRQYQQAVDVPVEPEMHHDESDSDG